MMTLLNLLHDVTRKGWNLGYQKVVYLDGAALIDTRLIPFNHPVQHPFSKTQSFTYDVFMLTL